MVQVKICGIKTMKDAKVAIAAGARYIGLNFEEKSPRYLTMQEAVDLSSLIIGENAIPVGVFTHHHAEQIADIVRACNLTVVQLHGERARLACDDLAIDLKRIYVVEFDQAGNIHVDADQEIDDCLKKLDKNRDYLLFDSTLPGRGQETNINKKNSLININGFRYFIAGGLNINNIQDKICEYQPYGVDVASGVESVRGVKSQTLIKQFIYLAQFQGGPHVANT
ncbi:N-(5'-phosphoribosyl)anthranilate isomerase [Piscirickettsia salmonis]|uniref:phosphoribosylanthranilate isomerase n=1 Tax=Piscirickettsia salmonis TaxID=1238 RepID=UPI0012B8C936|nr:phosphoribosylanthranilate isomerase [Piscirickettsia salmonis]QGP51942.1 N-(5'-phosphoribosyl)anthranilate isomerase [Piscirickettsia salmonis]QGP56497.1 N-(5'-phosphoribosyl)anthranilate isomerase [Piscirickettsia salmonis]QGP61295.1 N-(5'-phosphoribosyl)anthranilate isomerase [Piscirickettsia salmonis]QGP66061.1 N-(5'-phosphoribosyl)anthranilate isomerase [Piscirickettsia salmonis]